MTDQAVIDRLQSKAYRLDHYIHIGKHHIGYNTIIGLIPFIGFIIIWYHSITTYALVYQLDTTIPLYYHFKLLFNILIESVANAVPFIGPLFNNLYMTNTRNANIIINYLNHIETTAIPKNADNASTVIKDDEYTLYDNDSNLSYTNMSCNEPDLQQRLNQHQRKLSSHLYEHDPSVSSGFFK